MNADKITRIAVRGVRCLRNISLDLRGMTVLIGETGTGKSSILEALEVLRLAADPTFGEQINAGHGGIERLLSFGEHALDFQVWADGRGDRLEYHFRLRREAKGQFVVDGEHLHLEGSPPVPPKLRRRGQSGMHAPSRHPPGTVVTRIIERAGAKASHANAGKPGLVSRPMEPSRLMLSAFGEFPPHPAVNRMLGLLRSIEVHVPFEIVPDWVARVLRRPMLRDSEELRSVDRLGWGGMNLANVFHRLKNERPREHWDQTLDYVRLGLGQEVEDVRVVVPAGGGRIALEVKYRYFKDPVPASVLSDGTLAYLAFVALTRANTDTSLIAFDEPETHLHPGLLARVVDLLEEASTGRQVVLATHSDRLLDALSSPADAVVLTELDERGDTRLLRPDAARLARWLEEYRGIGDLRAAGHVASVMRDGEPR